MRMSLSDSNSSPKLITNFTPPPTLCSALEMTLESQTFRVKAKDLILKDNPDVVDGDRQCNRILMNDADDSVLPFDCTAGMVRSD